MDTTSTELSSLMDEMEIAGAVPDTDQLSKVACALAKCFEVEPDEVAVLTFNAKKEILRFVIPVPLSQVGTIPLNSSAALVARTVRERRAEVNNNASAARHLNVFEGVPMGRQPGDYIHKLMSAPIQEGTDVVGAVQISRKGQSPASAGPDFTLQDLAALKALSPVLVRFLKICQTN